MDRRTDGAGIVKRSRDEALTREAGLTAGAVTTAGLAITRWHDYDVANLSPCRRARALPHYRSQLALSDQ